MLLPLDQLTLTVKKGLNTPTNCVLPPRLDIDDGA